MLNIPLRRLALRSVLAFLFVCGYAGLAKADGFKVDSFKDDTAGWSLVVDVTADTDDDGATDIEEGTGDRDGDGKPNFEDYDPTGYFYDVDTGRILAGGSVSVSGCNHNLIENGSQGFYQFIGTDLGTCTISITNPPGYELATQVCPNLDPPPFNVPNGPGAPVVLGATEVGATGFLSSNGCTPYYFSFTFDSFDDVDVLANNFPFRRAGAAAAPAASTYGLAAMVVVLLILGTWRMALPSRR